MQIMAKFGTTSVTQVARGRNRHTDSLATLASAMTEDIPRQIKVELIAEPSISAMADWAKKVDVAAITKTRSCWMDQLLNFSSRIGYRMMKVRLTRFVDSLTILVVS